MIKCEGCGKPDFPEYDPRNDCSCENHREHAIDAHKPHCRRVRHSIKPYLYPLRRVNRKKDLFEDGQILKAIPGKAHEFQRYLNNGFRVKAINNYLYAQKFMCPDCIRIWGEREEKRKDYERQKRGNGPASYYTMLCS